MIFTNIILKSNYLKKKKKPLPMNYILLVGLLSFITSIKRSIYLILMNIKQINEFIISNSNDRSPIGRVLDSSYVKII